MPSEATDKNVETETEDTETLEEKSSIENDLKGTDQNQLLLAMMADEDIQAVLNAKRSGKAVKISAAEEEAEEEEDEIDDDVDVPDEVVKKLTKIITKQVKAEYGERMEALEDLAAGVQKNTVNQQIAAAAAKYTDLNEYRKSMAALARENPGLDIEALYLVAKHKAGKLNVAVPSTDSERPTASARTRMGRGKTKEKPGISGRRQFQNTLADALDQIDLNQLEG